MRKHKSVVAILLAVMMIFTFMPTMAFASEWDYEGSDPTKGKWSETESWDSTFSKVSITSAGTTKTYSNVTKTWYPNEYGAICSELDWSDYEGTHDAVSAYEFYYDLANAEINAKGTWTYDAFNTYAQSDGTLSGVKIKINKPTDSKIGVYPSTSGAKSAVFNDSDYTVTVKYDGFDKNSFAEQKVTLTATVTPNYSGEYGAYLAKRLVGAVASKEITVEAQEAAASKVKFAVDDLKKSDFKDGVSVTGTNFTGTYDGKAHTIVNSEVPGYTVSYEVQNPTTKVWTAAEPTFKDAATAPYLVRATITDANGKKYQKVLSVRVDNANEFVFRFKDTVRTGTRGYTKVSESADPASFVEAVIPVYKYDEEEDEFYVSDYKAINDADAEEAMKYFAEKYEIKATPDPADASFVTWTIKPKKDADDDALAKTYKTLFSNYGITNKVAELDDQTTARVQLVAAPVIADQADDVTFTKAQGQKYSYKKVLKKKSKSFKVKAVADSGKTVKYYIVSSNTNKIKINATTGKVTVKKGLKKGTYTLTIKAKTVAGEGYKAASEKATVKVKVTK